MTIETNSGQIKFDGSSPEDQQVLRVIGLGVLASETSGVLHDLKDQQVWPEEEEQSSPAPDQEKVDAITKGLRLVRPDFDPKNPVLTMEPEEFPLLLDALEDADDLGVEGVDHSEFVEVEKIFGKAA